MYYWDLARHLTKRFRRRRYNNFKALFPPEQYKRILDLGGSAELWEMMEYPGDITLLNISDSWLKLPVHSERKYTTVVGDGRQTTYSDAEFDLVFSNSVIEHVGTHTDAQRFAGEMQRVGRAFCCQTPNKWFPVEPHLGTLFLHWLPSLLEKYWILRYFTLWGLMHKPDRETAKIVAKDARLLTKSDLKGLFPGAEIITERVLLLPKSYTVVRRQLPERV